MRSIYIICCAIVGGFVAWTAQPYVHDNTDAMTILVTVLTVLAGFMIAIITVLGDPASIPGGNWRSVAVRRDSMENKIIRHGWLFILYLLAIAFLFTGTILKKVPEAKLSVAIGQWVDYGYIFLGVTSFLLSFALPFSLMKIQMGRLAIEEDRRRKEASSAAKIPED